MPPISQQGSRTGLIATLVIFVVLFMVAAIMWIYKDTQLTRATTTNNTLQQKYDTVIAPGDLSGGDTSPVTLLQAPKDKLGADAGNTAVELALAQIKALTKDITGTPSTSYADADTKAAEAVAKAVAAMKTAGTTSKPAASQPSGMPAGESLVSIVQKLSDALNAQTTANVDARKKLASVDADVKKQVAAWNAQIAASDAKVKDLTDKYTAAQTALTAAAAKYESMQTEADKTSKTSVETSGQQVQEAQTQIAQAKADNAKKDKYIHDLEIQLQKYRMDTKDSTVRQADGSLVRVPSNTVCYINLGQGDHISAGMTFEVYDKAEGVPGLGKDPLGDVGLPAGKASIEVVRIGQNSSECRIVHKSPNVTLQEGDVIANLVYDKNTTYNFFVFGNFDTDGNGIWTAQEADVVKSLVSRWGGKLGDKIGTNTDFIVLGKEPEVPALTKVEMEDPLLRAKYEKAAADLKAYQEVVNEAATLGIPIMNQNRFLYYIGYFDQIKR